MHVLVFQAAASVGGPVRLTARLEFRVRPQWPELKLSGCSIVIYKDELECRAMSHPNERVELAMQILECRRRLRQSAWDDATVKTIQAEMKLLEQKLRQIDE